MSDSSARIPSRSEVAKEDQWDLSGLYKNDEAWDKGLKELEELIPRIEEFKGKLHESAASLRGCFDFMNELELLAERIGSYAHLRFEEDSGDGDRQARWARFITAATKADTAASYQTPEIQAIATETMDAFLADPILDEFIIPLKKILRFKPHILSEKEERLLSMQIEANQTAKKAFAALTDVDMEFGEIETPDGPRPLSQSTYITFMMNPEQKIRAAAYKQFYSVFDGHKNAIAALLAGSVQLDKYRAEVRNYSSSKAAALFPDNVPASVFDNLISTVTDHLPALHQYYDVKRRAIGLDKLMHHDVYAPFVQDIEVNHTYDEAVDVVCTGLSPLGDEYTSVLRKGLTTGWVDRYENKGKRSGAFSAGSYVGDPYILMNFKESVLRDLFTLAHEGGHSMHSYYSVANNPYQYYNYTIFEAEVASTVNEQLVASYMMDQTSDKKMLAYLIGKQLDDMVGTIYRQTMFAEFEDKIHGMAESGAPLTVDSLRSTYRGLLEKYFGPEIGLLEESDLEGLRIPHFYNSAFYVYKYATGLSAAVSLGKRILNGSGSETQAYLDFLKSGGSRYPLESLALAGVDMSKPEPIREALETFGSLVKQLEELLWA